MPPESLTAMFHGAGDDDYGHPFDDDVNRSHALTHKDTDPEEKEKFSSPNSNLLDNLIKGLEGSGADKRIVDKAIDLIKVVKRVALEYSASVHELKRARGKLSKGGKNEAEGAASVDAARRNKHELLIDAVNSAIRYINKNFGEDVEFASPNILCPPSVMLQNRDSVGAWARGLAREMRTQEKLSQNN